MPIYTYHCKHCKTTIEARRTIGNHLTECPDCGNSLQRRYDTFRFRFRSPSWNPYSVESSEREELVKEEICVSDAQ